MKAVQFECTFVQSRLIEEDILNRTTQNRDFFLSGGLEQSEKLSTKWQTFEIHCVLFVQISLEERETLCTVQYIRMYIIRNLDLTWCPRQSGAVFSGKGKSRI